MCLKSWNCAAASIAAILLIASGELYAGEIAGVPPPLPPFADPKFQTYFVNDALGRGGEVDDFRTQQMGVAVRLAPSWLALVDHSILTLEDSQEQGRTDQTAVSLGYTFYETSRDDRDRNRLLLGYER